MKISDPFKKFIANELKYVAKNMRETDNPVQKLYFYSAAYGVIFRVLNFEFDPMLVHIFSILDASYNTINFMVQRVVRGEEQSIMVPKESLVHLANAVEELGNKIDKDEDVNPTLQKITNIAYVATGNGYYLYRKGLLRFDSKTPKQNKLM